MINLVSSGAANFVLNLEGKWRQEFRRLGFDAGLPRQTVEEMLQLGSHFIGRSHLLHQPVLVKDANVDVLTPISVRACWKDSADWRSGSVVGSSTSGAHVFVSFGPLALP